jgi:flavin reductase (DIM6/NTAB) family NADH-FMN oxidoreductase RutF
MSADMGLFKSGMRRLAGGVTLVTTLWKGERGGLTATAVCSVSAEPPQLLACVNKTASAHDLIVQSGVFCVNLLGTQHLDLAARFSGQHGVEGDERFEQGEWRTLATGCPVLPDALASFDCRTARQIEVSSHTIFIGHIVDIAVAPGQPLIHADGGFLTGTHATAAF